MNSFQLEKTETNITVTQIFGNWRWSMHTVCAEIHLCLFFFPFDFFLTCIFKYLGWCFGWWGFLFVFGGVVFFFVLFWFEVLINLIFCCLVVFWFCPFLNFTLFLCNFKELGFSSKLP